jgi:hypothetical protein
MCLPFYGATPATAQLEAMRSLRGRVGLAELVLPQSDPQQRPLGPGAVASRVVTTKALAPARKRELVLAAAAGDRAACEELVQAFLPAIAGVARRYRGAHSVQRPEPLQEGGRHPRAAGRGGSPYPRYRTRANLPPLPPALPAATIFPLAWIATPLAKSSPKPLLVKSVTTLPLPLNVVSRLPLRL